MSRVEDVHDVTDGIAVAVATVTTATGGDVRFAVTFCTFTLCVVRITGICNVVGITGGAGRVAGVIVLFSLTVDSGLSNSCSSSSSSCSSSCSSSLQRSTMSTQF